ncbi:hypothetical protein jhhlp_007681 [Lomentospora prolificans]|uniref:Capsule polysaccharide biosynthesis protein n=1 Tax=Lomentospora prolificans TaxID=41688 RepID=A0A2N3N0B5_9PEZI|nr:hypothetical protein jhhlp_007681 [Lomentospora prolificans]
MTKSQEPSTHKSSGSPPRKMSALALLVPMVAPLAVASAGYAAWKVQWLSLLKAFFTGPGRLQRIFLLLFTLFNWKNMPFAWTLSVYLQSASGFQTRVFYAVYYHHIIRRAPALGPPALFAPVISGSRAPLLEIDYNIHKSNSTYFADLDVSRTHLVSYICGPGLRALSKNKVTQLVLDPTTKNPAPGKLGIMLGGVHCSFHREIPPYAAYELWSRVLSWDRKWLYIVTHYVPKGLGRPSEWLDPRFGRLNRSAGKEPSKDWEKKIHATAVSKYVFKLGRLTIHPAIVLAESGLLPTRPGGWIIDDLGTGMGGTAQTGDCLELRSDPGEWDWKRVERRRVAGMQFAEKFHAMDSLQKAFDGGRGAVVGRFGPG